MNQALSTQSIVTRRYMFEPGDGSRYNFMLHWFTEPEIHVPNCASMIDDDMYVDTYIETDVAPERIIPGIAEGGYIGITVCLPYDQGDIALDIGEFTTGSYEFMRKQLREYSGGNVAEYAAAHMRCHIDVLIPILAAASVLADEPDNLKDAILAMRKAVKSREGSQI